MASHTMAEQVAPSPAVSGGISLSPRASADYERREEEERLRRLQRYNQPSGELHGIVSGRTSIEDSVQRELDASYAQQQRRQTSGGSSPHPDLEASIPSGDSDKQQQVRHTALPDTLLMSACIGRFRIRSA